MHGGGSVGRWGCLLTLVADSCSSPRELHRRPRPRPPHCPCSYYGTSLPFGDAAYDTPNLAYLSAEQALVDYVSLMHSLKANLSAEASPVIVFGGSYGGMLAAWAQIRHPGAFAGAIAASAPILQFDGEVSRVAAAVMVMPGCGAFWGTARAAV